MEASLDLTSFTSVEGGTWMGPTLADLQRWLKRRGLEGNTRNVQHQTPEPVTEER